MKSHTQPVTWTHRAWADAVVTVDECRSIRKTASVVNIETESAVRRRAMGDSLAGPLRIVVVLAFCQTIFFIALFLFICARAGAATESKPTFNPELSVSAYMSKTVRDPFGSEAVKSSGTLNAKTIHAATPGMLKLKGILYDTVHPSALVNDQLVELNKPVTVGTEQGAMEIKALKISREAVLLEVQGQKVELRLGGDERDKEVK